MKRKVTFVLLLMITAATASAQLLYRISGKGLKAPSYIIGTYHLASASFADSIPGLKAAIDASSQVCGEVDMSDMMSPDNMKRMQVAMMLPEGKTLKPLLSEDEMKRFNAVMRGLLGVDMTNASVAQQLGRLTPIALNTQFTLLMFLKKHPGFDEQNQLDGYFQKVAKEKGKTVIGLETIDFQIRMLYENMNLERQKELLMCLVDNMDFNEKMVDDIVNAYKAQNIKAMQKAMDTKLHNNCDNTPEEDANLIYNRNINWYTKMPTIMQEKPTLFVVGAGHLVGGKGLLTLFKNGGYTVEGVK